MYPHSYALALLQDRQRDLSEAAERRNRTSPTRSTSRGTRRRLWGPRA